MALWVREFASLRRWIGFSEDDGYICRRPNEFKRERASAKEFGGEAALVWQRVEDNAFHLCETLALPFPKKFRGAINLRWKAFVHRTIERSLLKDFPLRMIGREWDMNF